MSATRPRSRAIKCSRGSSAISAMIEPKAVLAHPLGWVLEPLEKFPGYLRRKMFGCEAAYLNGRLVLMLAAGGEPWNGLMVATSREFHADLQSQWKPLKSHPVLGKWLYLSQTSTAFDEVAVAIVASICRGDARIGVEPRPKKRKR